MYLKKLPWIGSQVIVRKKRFFGLPGRCCKKSKALEKMHIRYEDANIENQSRRSRLNLISGAWTREERLDRQELCISFGSNNDKA